MTCPRCGSDVTALVATLTAGDGGSPTFGDDAAYRCGRCGHTWTVDPAARTATVPAHVRDAALEAADRAWGEPEVVDVILAAVADRLVAQADGAFRWTAP